MPEFPLSSLKVVDVSELLPGPQLGQNFADLGATVTKVERPNGDPARHTAPGVYNAVNRNKTVHSIDLKTTAGATALDTLLETADILIEGFRPGTMARLGFAPDRLLTDFPRLIVVSICGFAVDSAEVNDPGHDVTYAGYSGALSLAGSDPVIPDWSPGFPIADLAASSYAMSGALAALYHRQSSGRGSHVIVPITDALSHYLNPRIGTFSEIGAPTLKEQRHLASTRPAYGLFACADTHRIAVAALEDHFWDRLKTALDLEHPELHSWKAFSARSAAADRVNAAIASKLETIDSLTALRILKQADVPVAPVRTIDEALAAARTRTTSPVGGATLFPFPASFHAIDD